MQLVVDNIESCKMCTESIYLGSNMRSELELDRGIAETAVAILEMQQFNSHKNLTYMPWSQWILRFLSVEGTSHTVQVPSQ